MGSRNARPCAREFATPRLPEADDAEQASLEGADDPLGHVRLGIRSRRGSSGSLVLTVVDPGCMASSAVRSGPPIGHDRPARERSGTAGATQSWPEESGSPQPVSTCHRQSTSMSEFSGLLRSARGQRRARLVTVRLLFVIPARSPNPCAIELTCERWGPARPSQQSAVSSRLPASAAVLGVRRSRPASPGAVGADSAGSPGPTGLATVVGGGGARRCSAALARRGPRRRRDRPHGRRHRPIPRRPLRVASGEPLPVPYAKTSTPATTGPEPTTLPGSALAADSTRHAPELSSRMAGVGYASFMNIFWTSSMS